MFTVNALPKHLRPRREKVFGLARGSCVHDRNARVRIETYVLAWNAKQKQEGQHQGPITAAYQRLPPLRWGFPLPCHVFGDRGLANVDAELEELAVDPGSTPQRIGETHVPDQLAIRAAPLACRREIATSIARKSENQRHASG